MKKAQLRIPLVIFGIIAIVALVGMILLFPSLGGVTQLGIGDPYGPTPGIANTVKLPPNRYGGPEPQFPAGGPLETIGSRTPAMIFFRGEYSNIADMAKCWSDLQPKLAAAQQMFDCYAVPTSLPAYEVTGFFYPTVSSLPRPLYDLGGDIYCYLNSPYDRDSLVQRLKPIVAENGWRTDLVNGKETLVCTKGANFIFPQ